MAYHDHELVGQLVVTDADFPWLTARFQAEAGFEKVRPLFEEELRLLDSAATPLSPAAP